MGVHLLKDQREGQIRIDALTANSQFGVPSFNRDFTQGRPHAAELPENIQELDRSSRADLAPVS